MFYRLAQESDIDEICRLIRNAIANMEKNDIFQWDNIYPAKEDFLSDIKKQQLFVGLLNQDISVLYAINKECDREYENGKWKHPDLEYRVIHRLCVNPEYQNRGIAKDTLVHIEQELKKRGKTMSTGIMIIGPSGSGKTSLGKIVAEKLGFPYFDVDDYIWKKDTSAPYTQMYSKAEKIRLLKSDIEPYEHFVMAGSMSSFHQAFDDKFEMMVFLYAEPEIRLRRVHKRAMERFGKRILEGGDLYESHQKFLESNRRYETDGSPNLGEQKEWIKNLPCVKIELDGTSSLESNAKIIVEKWNKMKG